MVNKTTNSQQDNDTVFWDALKVDSAKLSGSPVVRAPASTDPPGGPVTDSVDRRKDDIAQSVADFATSLRESTHSFDERPNIRAVVDTAAEGLEQLADSIRERTFADFFNEFEGVVRRRPATVAAVSVAVGFLAARFIKSTAEDLRYDGMNAGSAQGSQGRTRQQGQQRSRAKTSA